MEVVQDWVAANPERVVPVQHHDGDNHPYEDYVTKICQEKDDRPKECARMEGVTLP